MKRARSSSYAKRPYKKRRVGSVKKKTQIFRIGKAVTVVHKEFLGDVRNFRNFQTTGIELNPGLEESFPWLHQIAAGYEQYQFNALKFSYKPTFANVTSTSSGGLGSIVMATRYNALDGDFFDKREMENSEGAVSFRPSVRGKHNVNVKAQTTVCRKQYVRTSKSFNPTGNDKRFWDLGKFTMAVVGMDPGTGLDNAVSIGELWVSYSVTFYKPRYKNVINSDHMQLTGVTNALPFGSTTLSNVLGSSLGGLVTGGNIYKFPDFVRRGLFLFCVSWTGGVVTANFPTINVANGVLKQFFQNDTNTDVHGPQNALTNTQNMLMNFIVQVTSPGCTVTIGGTGTLPSAATNCDLFVTEVSDTITG